jgi:hypothetical protein
MGPSDDLLNSAADSAQALKAFLDRAPEPQVGGPLRTHYGEHLANLILPVEAALRITLLERNGAALHELSIVQPEDTVLAGPGYLFPGPFFRVGPYSAGTVSLRLDTYNNYPPHQWFNTGEPIVTGEFPSWIIEWEDLGDDDFDDIIVGVEVIPAFITMDCSPNSVERATTPVSCVPVAPAGSTTEITGWRFVGGSNDDFEVTSGLAAPATWEGLMVVGGTVTVYADVDGVPDSAKSAVTVTPRSWPITPVLEPVPEITPSDPRFDLPVVPDSLHHLGHAHKGPELDPDYGQPLSGTVLPVTSGPNNLLVYNASPPVVGVWAYTEINRAALTDTSNPWYQSHPIGGNGNTCRRRDLESFVLDSIVSHEAQHVDFARDWFGESSNSYNSELVSEGIVLQSPNLDAVRDSTRLDT